MLFDARKQKQSAEFTNKILLVYQFNVEVMDIVKYK